jgi:hypothetical protein
VLRWLWRKTHRNLPIPEARSARFGLFSVDAVKMTVKFTAQERERQSGYDTANYIGDVDWPLRLAVRACTRLQNSSRKRGLVPRFFVSGLGAFPHSLH